MTKLEMDTKVLKKNLELTKALQDVDRLTSENVELKAEIDAITSELFDLKDQIYNDLVKRKSNETL